MIHFINIAKDGFDENCGLRGKLILFLPAVRNSSTSASLRREKNNLKLSAMENELFQSETLGLHHGMI